jgi:rsbT co-antagonist protein RsbR
MQFKQAITQSQARARKAATFQTLTENATDAIGMTDQQGQVVYVNEAFCQLFDCDDVSGKLGHLSITSLMPADEAARFQPIMAQVMHEGWSGEIKAQRQDGSLFEAWLTIFPLQNETGEPTGTASIIRDMTGQKQAEAERAQLQQEIIEAQQHTLKELSTPIIPVAEAPDGMGSIIVMPLIGSIDTMRARDITRALLKGISDYRAKIVIVDITGVPLVDSGVANYLNKTILAARLKGARTIVTGISDAVAETIIDLGIDWSGIETLSDLQTGLRAVLPIRSGQI